MKFHCSVSTATALISILMLACPAAAHDDVRPMDPDSSNAQVEAAIRVVAEKYKEAQQKGASSQSLANAEAVYWGALTWKKHALTVCFWNGADDMRAKVEDRASAWPNAANISFLFKNGSGFRECTDETSADIRISLDGNDSRPIYQPDDDKFGDWSQIGSLAISEGHRHKVTMNLALLPSLIVDPTNFDFHIRHEFGHALGLLHEHQRELCDGWFDYKQIAADQGWSIQKAKQNVGAFPTEDLGGIMSLGPYDKNSIMQYNFALDWYVEKPPTPNPCERDHDVGNLSPKDIAVVQRIYGLPPKAVAGVNPVQSADSRAPGWASDIKPNEIKQARADISVEIDANQLNAASATNMLKQLQAQQAQPVQICTNILGTRVCNLTTFGSTVNGTQQLRSAALTAKAHGEDVAASLSALAASLDHLNQVVGGN